MNPNVLKIKGLYAIVDTTFSPERSHRELAASLLEGGCQLIQLRMKRGATSEIFQTAAEIMKFKKDYDFTFIVNDRLDVAREVGADGVHVGADDSSIEEIRRQVGRRLIIGYSSHSIEESVEAERRGADYVAFGAVFPTKTKGPGHSVQGVEKLRDLVSKISVPVVAIGGINRSNVSEVLSTGVDAVAMITALTQAEDVVAETKRYVDHIKNSSHHSRF